MTRNLEILYLLTLLAIVGIIESKFKPLRNSIQLNINPHTDYNTTNYFRSKAVKTAAIYMLGTALLAQIMRNARRTLGGLMGLKPREV